MAKKIFISYNHNDKILIHTITKRLELEGRKRGRVKYENSSNAKGDLLSFRF